MFRHMCDQDKTFCNLYDGEWIKASQSEFLEVVSPVDGSLVGRVPAMTRGDVDRAIENTKKGLPEWAKTPVHERANVFYRAADLLEEHAEEIANVLTMEIAKDKHSALFEVKRTADFFRYTADAGKSMAGEAIGGDNFPGGSRNKISYVSRVPLGTVLAISPFNYPINLSASKLAPALIGGNAVLLKPASQGAISALYLADVLQEAGLPPGVLNTITGRGSEIGDYLVTHPEINFINFTGSTAVGKRIAKLAGMIPLMLELGGKDAAIVLPDADLEFAAQNIISGAYAYAGQRCTAVKRILTEDGVADRLIPKLLNLIGRLKVGDPAAGRDHRAVDQHTGGGLRDGPDRRRGAKGREDIDRRRPYGQPDRADAGGQRYHRYAPGVGGAVRPGAADYAREGHAGGHRYRQSFGIRPPVLGIHQEYPRRVLRRQPSGGRHGADQQQNGARPDHFPFLGVKASGMGTQGVKYAIEAMTRPKAIVFNLQDGGNTHG